MALLFFALMGGLNQAMGSTWSIVRQEIVVRFRRLCARWRGRGFDQSMFGNFKQRKDMIGFRWCQRQWALNVDLYGCSIDDRLIGHTRIDTDQRQVRITGLVMSEWSTGFRVEIVVGDGHKRRLRTSRMFANKTTAVDTIPSLFGSFDRTNQRKKRSKTLSLGKDFFTSSVQCHWDFPLVP